MESLALDGGNDLMESADALPGFKHTVVCGSCSFSSEIDVLVFYVSKHSVSVRS